MFVIDVNTSFGKRVAPDPRYSPDALVAELDRHEVALALSYSQQAAHYDPRAGNGEALALAAAQSCVLPVAVLDPRDTPGWERELARARAAGVKAVRVFPGEQRWSVQSVRFRRMVEALRGTGMCLMVSAVECPTGWELAGEVARVTAGRDVPVVLTDTYYNNMSEVMAVMQEHPHVFAETNWLATVGEVELLAEAVGADRLLYGSGAPARPMQKSLNQVLEADMSAEDKAAVLGGNAARLLGIPADRLAGRPELSDLEPKAFREQIVDVHSHLGYWRIPCRDEDYDPGPMLSRMRRYGIERSIVSSYESMRYDVAAGNRALAGGIAGCPELLGYVELDPHHLALSCAEMDRYYQLPNFVGCEVELSHIPCPIGSEKVRALFREIAKRGRPVLFFSAASDDGHAERELARAHPDLTIIHAHGAGPDWARTVRDTPNLCIEFCLSRPSHHDLRDSMDILGPERVLFGTDQTLLGVGGQVGLYLDAQMSAAERRLVLLENAQRVFGLGTTG